LADRCRAPIVSASAVDRRTHPLGFDEQDFPQARDALITWQFEEHVIAIGGRRQHLDDQQGCGDDTAVTPRQRLAGYGDVGFEVIPGR
jgi:hypothetical protein